MSKKIKIISVTAPIAFAITGVANAGTWSLAAWTNDSSLPTINASNIATHSGDFALAGGSVASIGGHTFERITIPTGFSSIVSPHNGSNFTITSSTATIGTYESTQSPVSGTQSALLSTGLSFGAHTLTYALTGLQQNTNYSFYYFSSDWVDGSRTITLDGGDDGAGNPQTINQNSGVGNYISRYNYNTGSSTTFAMTVTNNGSGHHFGFLNTVPEPSATLLGGIGMLAMLRRRR